MTASMTAFARQQAEFDWGMLVWEIRTVNHRFLEPSFRLPETLRNLEPRLREKLRDTLGRGKFEAQLKFSPRQAANKPLRINEALISQLQHACSHLNNEISEPGPVSPLDLLRWPGVVQEQEEDIQAIEGEALALFETSLERLVAQREREGQALATCIRQRLDSIADIVVQVREALPTILKRQRERLANQLAQLQVELDPGRLEQEVVLLTQKADIHEELDRLDTHLKEVRRTLDKQGPIGRRLDFLMQELNREANTLSAKAVVADTTLSAVELKVLIEQMREQVQNIE